MTAYVPTSWENNVPPPLSAANLNKLTDELKAQATETGFTNTLPTWVDGAAPALTDADALNEIERCLFWIADGLGLTYERTAWQAGWTPSRNAYHFNKMEQQLAANRTALDAPAPPPSGGLTSPYFDFDFVKIADPPWTSIQTDYGAGAYGPGSTGVQTSTDGYSVGLVTAPDGSGRALRFELRDASIPWPPDTSGKRSQIQMNQTQTWNGVPYTVGRVNWFYFELWLPNDNPGGEYFDWGRSNWNTWIGLHPAATGVPGWGCFDLGTDGPYTHPFYMTWKLAGGGGAYPTDTLVYPRLFQLTNADGTRYAPNYNRRLQLLIGAKFDPTHNGGWMEAWVDGVNVLPRFNHATMWTGDTSTYFKCGPYKSSSGSSVFPTNGKSVIYFTRMQFGETQ